MIEEETSSEPEVSLKMAISVVLIVGAVSNRDKLDMQYNHNLPLSVPHTYASNTFNGPEFYEIS